MNEFQQGADAIRRLAVQFKAIVAVAEGLDRIGSLENAERESAIRIEATRKAEAAAKDDLARVQDELIKAREAAERILEESRDEAAKTVQEGQRQAEEIKSVASQKAKYVIGEAETVALDLRQSASKEAKRLADENQDAERKLIETGTQLAKAQDELRQVKEQIESARAAMLQFIGK